MAKQEVDIGVEGNDGTGDSIRESFRKVNENFTELYAVFGVEGSLSFLSLGDTPNSYENNKILTTNATGDAVILSSITSSNGTISVDVLSTPGEIDLSVSSIEIVQDTVSPTLGNHLSAANKAIGGVQISESAATALSNQPGRSQVFTIDDLVITKGYADRRYITSGLPIRVADEPANTDAFTLTIDSYNGDGHLVFTSGHGYDSGANGTAFIFYAEDTDPSGAVTGTTYYIRYESSTELSLYATQEQAQEENQSVADVNKIIVTGTIASDDTHTIVDAGFDADLPGNFLSDVAMPRKSVVRRQGDTMEGNLFLNDHPGDLAGAGTPNGAEDLQAATKYYVDNTAYSSPEVLFVSTAGDDSMKGVPAGKEGTANTYSFKSINAAARRANELINTAPEEPGPYFQTLSYGATTNTQGTAALVTSSGVENQQNVDTRSILLNNRQYLIKEITGYIAFTYPDFAYNVDTCERDLGLIIDSVSFDALRGNTANYLSRTAAERYYSSVSGRIAITSQLERTDDSFAKLSEFSQAVLTNSLFNPKTVSAISKKVGDSPASVTTTTAHGLINGNQVIFKNVSGMTEIEDEIVFIKKTDDNNFELYTDVTLETPYDNSSYTTFVNDGAAQIGVRYQSKYSQDVSVTALTPTDNGYVAVTQNYALIRNIINNGIDAGADVVFGNRYELNTDNSTAGILDQTNPDNVDALPGKVIRGKRSGAVGRIITFEQNTTNTTFYLQPLEAKDFDVNEELEMGNYVKAKQVVIRVEAGIYEEDYPIKLTKNVSLKGDEFRRVIVRPKRRVSQSIWANTYFYRDKEFDGIEILDSGTPFVNQVGDVQGYFGYHYLTNNTKPVSVGSPITNNGGYNTAANILELNKEFIQEEIIEYIDANFQDLLYDQAKCRRDTGLILDAVGFDIALGTNYNAVTAGIAYQRANNAYNISNEKANTVAAIQFARDEVAALTNVAGDATALSRSNDAFNEIVDIINNGTLGNTEPGDGVADALVLPTPTGASANLVNAKDALQANRDFLRAEITAYIAVENPTLEYDVAKCSRDVGYIVDALSYDILYGGNSASIQSATSYFVGSISQLGFGEAAATSDAYTHLASVVSDVVQDVAVTPSSGNAVSQVITGSPASASEASDLSDLIQITIDVIDDGDISGLPATVNPSVTWAASTLQAARSDIVAARTTIIDDTIDYINNTLLVTFVYNKTKCRRDVGLIVDAIVNDLVRGGDEAVLEAQGEYYSNYIAQFNNNGFDGQQNITEAAIAYISTIAADLLDGNAPATILGTIEADLTGGPAETVWASGVSYTQGDFVEITRGVTTFVYQAKTTHISEDSDQDQDSLSASYLELTNTQRWQSVSSAISLVGELVDKVNYAFDEAYNPPKRNDADGVDVFLMDDATIVRNVTVQGHGGFMCVLDPVGQVLTKSPYIQTASSFSRSRNAKAFTGGMYVDAFCGNIPMRIQANSGNYTDSAGTVALDAFTLYVESQDVGGIGQGLKLRLPELPAPFYFEGIRYQVNAISNYDSSLGRAVIYLDPNSGNGLGWNKVGADDIGDPGHDPNDTIQDIFLQTAGNRSILGNDFTQINDLGYGLVTTNGAFSEMVSMFTYYCEAAYYAANGSEIRSLNGSNGYGNFGLVAEGADPNEIPDEVTIARSSIQPIKAFTYGASFLNDAGDTSITVYDFKEPPLSNSYFYVDHGGATGPLNYRISRVENLSDPNSVGIPGIGATGAIVNTGLEAMDNASVTGTVPAFDGVYANVAQKSTSGSGTGAEFQVTINTGVATFVITKPGSGYATTDTVTISGADIGGVDATNDLTIDVDTIFGTTSGTYVDPQLTGGITAATTANPVVITSALHGLTSGDKIYIDNVLGMVNLNGNTYFVDVVDANTFALYENKSITIPVDGTNFIPYTSAGDWISEGGIGNHVYRLSLQEAGSNNDYFGELQDALSANDYLEYRHGENFIFTGVAAPDGISERPSTAVNFDESDLTTYRSTGFTQNDDQNIGLGGDEIKATFDTTFNYLELVVDPTKLTETDPDDGAKTLGSLVNDNKVAIEQIDEDDALRVVADSTDSANQNILYPGDVGYTGGMIFAYEGKLFQINEYGAVGANTISGATQADPVVITSTGHTLVNGDQISIRLVEGMTNLNGNTFFVGNVTANTFELYSDAGLSNTVNGTGYSAYISGGEAIKAGSAWYVGFTDFQTDSADWDITGTSANNGIKAAFTNERTLWCGLQSGTTAEITVSISLCRATGHDFTQIGTGGFNTSNYPNVLLGQPTEDKAPAYTNQDNASKAQVWERRKGRVFFISSDENGFFRVGKYFVVDQATGSITFSGEVGISRAASLGFKDGVVINEFSNDELFTDLSDTAVPTEKAIANYVSRRLGHNGSIQLTGASRFDPGFLALDGSTKMENTLNMNSQLISNLKDPVSDNDAVTKDFLDQAVSAYDELDDLRNVIIHPRTGADVNKQILVPTGYKRLVVDPTIGSITDGDILEDGSNIGTVVATESRFDKVLNKNVQIITYELTSGTGFNTTLTPVYVTSLGTKAADVLENPVDEFANAVESSTSDINITTLRSSSSPFTEINLQIESQAILNSDVNDDAGIVQNKLLMNRAKPIANSSGMYGTDGDAGISNTATITNITQASPAVVTTSAAHGLSTNELVQISDVSGMYQLNGNSYYVDVLSSVTFALYENSGPSGAVNSTSYGAYSSGGTAAGEATGTGRLGQTSRGLAAFEYESFAEDVKLTLTTSTISADAGDILYQGDPGTGTKPTGYVVNTVSGSSTVVIRTSDTWAVSSTPIYKSVVTNGVAATATNTTATVFTNGFERSGFISIKDRGIAYEKFPDLTGGNLADDFGGSVIGRATDGNGAAEEVSFLTVVEQGKGLTDNDFTTERGYWQNPPTNTIVNDPGDVLIQYGTPGDGDYAYTNIAYDNSSNSIVKRDVGGKIQATSLIIGGTSSYEILSESSGTLFFKTPDQGTILTSTGATKPTISTGGSIKVGDIPNVNESTFHQNSPYGSVGGAGTTEETSALAARWMYTSFIEAANEKDATGTGIGLGTNTGFSDGGADIITFVTNGAVNAKVTLNGIETDDIRSKTANTNLTVSANGTGTVYVNDTMTVIGQITGTIDNSDNINIDEKNDDVAYQVTFSAANGTGYQRQYIDTDNAHFTYNPSTQTLSGVRNISTGAATTTGTITGRWSLTSNSRFEATYADLAEYYEADAEYDAGTVLVFGGDKEVTTTTTKGDRRVAGVLSADPAYTMNQNCPGIAACIALQGRVPVKVLGAVSKGDIIVTSGIAGYGCVDNDPKPGTIIGKALSNKEDSGKGIIEVAVGRT